MPDGVAERDGAWSSAAPPVGDDPAGARVAAAQPRARRRRRCRRRARSRPASRACAAERSFSSRNSAGRAAEDAAAAAAARAARGRRRDRRPGRSARPSAVVAEDQRPDRVVVGARDPRASARRRQRHQQRPAPPTTTSASAAGQQLAHAARGSRAARPTATRRPARAPPAAPRAIFVSNPSPIARRRARASACARPPAPRTTPTAPPTQHSTSSASGLLWREIATAIGVSASASPATKPAGAPEAAARQVVDEPDGRDAHQRLRHEHRPRREAEGARRQRLHPQRERRLVDRHDAGWIEGAEEEVVPALRHRADGGAVVLVRPAVACQRPQVQGGGQREQQEQLRAGDGTTQQAGTALLALRRDGLGNGTWESGGGRRVGRRTTLEPEVHAGRIGSAPQPRARGT